MSNNGPHLLADTRMGKAPAGNGLVRLLGGAAIGYLLYKFRPFGWSSPGYLCSWRALALRLAEAAYSGG